MDEGSDEYKSEELIDPLDADGNMAGCNFTVAILISGAALRE
jgi:hypothetical protein